MLVLAQFLSRMLQSMPRIEPLSDSAVVATPGVRRRVFNGRVVVLPLREP